MTKGARPVLSVITRRFQQEFEDDISRSLAQLQRWCWSSRFLSSGALAECRSAMVERNADAVEAARLDATAGW